MQLSKYFLIFGATTLAISLTGSPGIAFNIKGQDLGRLPENYQAISRFPSGEGTTTLNAFDYLTPSSWLVPPGRVSEIARGGTWGLRRDLSPFRRRGWTFQRGGNLSGSFNVKKYYACGVNTSCGAGVGVPIVIPQRAVGATIRIDYEPQNSDPIPQPPINRLYWIQRVITNYSGSVGPRRSFIDNGGSLDDPFYNDFPLSFSESYFIDNPHRNFEFNKSFYWFAELYLAQQQPNTRKVTIYNGVRWGWRYDYQPCIASSGGGGCQTIRATNSVNEQTATSNSDEFSVNDFSASDTDIADISADLLEDPELSSEDSNFLASKNPNQDTLAAEPTPEPTTAFGTLLALGGLSLLAKLKHRKTKE